MVKSLQIAGISLDRLSAGDPVAAALAGGVSGLTGVELVRASVADVALETGA